MPRKSTKKKEEKKVKSRIKLDKWQEEFLYTPGNRILCCGRQIGKSVTCGIDAGHKAVNSKNKTFLMIAPTERQAYALFDKTLQYILEFYPKMIKKGKDKPTKTRIHLINGTKIYCLPTGLSGIGIRFLTVDELYADESSRIPEPVWDAVTPMLLTTGGNMTLLSTPKGSNNRFSEIVQNKDNAYSNFTRFEYSSRDVIEKREICDTWTQIQRDKALAYLDSEKKRMTPLMYAQEYEGKICDDLIQFFPDDLIKSVMTLPLGFSSLPVRGKKFLGVDVARKGGDEIVLFSLAKTSKNSYKQFGMKISKNKYLTETVDSILDLDKLHSYKKIYIDDGGLGVGVFDPLLCHPQTKRKVVAINNSARSLEHNTNRKKRILKEDLYSNLYYLMVKKKISLWNDPKIFQSLKSIQIDDSQENLKIFGNYTHITEALIRAAWCTKDKSLNIWIV